MYSFLVSIDTEGLSRNPTKSKIDLGGFDSLSFSCAKYLGLSQEKKKGCFYHNMDFRFVVIK
jgi:hypothetical protein